MPPRAAVPGPAPTAARWPAGLVWALAWATMAGLQDRLELANLALVLVLAAALSALWLPPWSSVAACLAAVIVFDLAFVPPRWRFDVHLQTHTLLLVTMLAVSSIVALLTARQRQAALAESMLARRAAQRHALGDLLRDSDDPASRAPELQALLSQLTGEPAALLLATAALPAEPRLSGAPDDDQRVGLALCLRQGQAMGPGTGRHEEQPAWYLPLRGRGAPFGAALLPLALPLPEPGPLLAHAQALCDQMGLALERARAVQTAAAARDEAQAHQLRHTVLAALSHDYRTPLAAILGAATSLHDQDTRLSPEQRSRLAASIADEAAQLARLTDNALQLARLGSPGLVLQADWESAEELVGSVRRRVRQRDPAQRVKARLEAGLPLLRCDAVLMVQLLENLVDNALKYGGDAAPVELLVRRVGDAMLLAVRDRGPGVPAAWRERIFDVFQRGEPNSAGPDAAARRGAGVGLAVCRAIAHAHGGTLRVRPRAHGGSSFECWLPVAEAPAVPPHPEAQAR